jgi:NAD(P)-dependent dehydrogenase (short-subunit alcohol dehydrogenase family)
MRVELGVFGIDVVLVEPGNVRSSFGETADRASAPVLDRRNSPYAPLYAGHAAATARLRAHEPGPEIVAKIVLHALTARRPRARYRVGVPLGTRVVLALPAAGWDPMMGRLSGVRKRPGSGGR